MSGRITVGLVLLFIVLGSYVYFFEFSADSNLPNEGGMSLYDSPYNEFDIVGLEIDSPQGSAHFVRTDDTFSQDWQMIAPQSISPAELDQVRVNGAAVRLGQLTAAQVITNVTHSAQYGLTPPVLTVTLTLSDGQKITLLTGNETPVNNSRYVQRPTDRQAVYLVFNLAVNELHQLVAIPPLAPTPLPTITPRPTP